MTAVVYVGSEHAERVRECNGYEGRVVVVSTAIILWVAYKAQVLCIVNITC